MSENKFRYRTSGRWYKGNTHIHSTVSDGGKTLKELDEMYSGVGYDFLFLTDHWVCSDFKKCTEKLKLLWMNGVEYDTRDNGKAIYHVVLLGNDITVNSQMTVRDAINEGRRKNAIVIFAHPGWSGNSTEDALKYDFDGVEIFNYTTDQTTGKSFGGSHLEQMLLKSPATLTFACDDAHVRECDPYWNGGWIVINTDSLNEKSIISAIRSGNYYSSTGPDFHEISFENNMINVKTSPVKLIRLTGPEYRFEMERNDKTPLTGHSFKIHPDWRFSYLEIEDYNGKKAWSNNLFI